MERLISDVLFYYNDTDYLLLNVENITINSSNDTLTDMCNISISKLDTYSTSTEINIQDNSFVLGSKVEIMLGYTRGSEILDQNVVYTGYLVGFTKSSDSTILNFEDDMYLLKSCKRVKKSFEGGFKLEDIITTVFSEASLETTPEMKVIDIDAGVINIINYLLPSEVLSMLKERFGIYCYFKNSILYLGHKYWFPYENTYGITGDNVAKTFQFKWPNTNEKPYYKLIDINELDYSIIDKNEYKVKGTSVYNFTPIKYEYPENTQDPKNIITLSLPDTDLATLTLLVKERYNQLDFGGFTGSFTCFGYPFIQHGDIVELEIDLSHIKDSPRIVTEKYFVDEITREFGSNGYKQTIKIGNQILN